MILQPFRHFTCVTTNSPTFPSLYLRHSPFSNPSVASPTSQLILQPFRRFTYVTAYSPTFPLLHLRHSSFSNPSFASTSTSQALHLRHHAHEQSANIYDTGRDVTYSNTVAIRKNSVAPCTQQTNRDTDVY